jgi:hypothetical protein
MAASAALVSFKHIKGANNTDILTASRYINARSLAAGTAETETVPTGVTGGDAAYVVFSSNSDFYVNWNGGTAAAPSGDTTDGSASELNPTERYIKGIASFSILAPSAATVSMAYYAE